MAVRLTDGVSIALATGERFVADASRPEGDISFVSHAHTDHLFAQQPADVVCSPLTAALAATRRGCKRPRVVEHPAVTLLDAGHIPGSRAALIDDGERRYLYTGDVATRDRLYLAGFTPVDADALIVEATYGRPGYRFPPQSRIERAILAWLNETWDVPAVLFGYPLGRAQVLQALAARSARDRVFVPESIARLNRVIEAHCDIVFETTTFDDHTVGPGDVVVASSGARRHGWVTSLVADGAVTAGFSGWAVDDSYRYRRGVDRAFPLSDHCDFPELLALVEAVDPEIVYTHHGFADALATHVTRELGIPARSLKRDQATLADF